MEVPPAQVEAALLQLPQSNNVARKEAEQFLLRLLKQPQSVSIMLNQTLHSAHRTARQLSALLIRERIVRHWKYMDKPTQQAVKRDILGILHNETDRAVVMAVASVATALAKFLVPVQQWNELVQFAIDASHAAEVRHREMAMVLFFFLLEVESVFQALHPVYGNLVHVFSGAMQDAESTAVRVYGMKAAGTLMEATVYDGLDVDIARLIPGMMKVAADALNEGEEETAFHTFDVIGALASSPGNALDAHIREVAGFMTRVATTPDLEHNTRESAVLVLEHLACYKPRVFTKAGLVQPTVDVLLRLMAEPREDEDESVDATPPPGAGPGTFGPDMRLDPAMIESEAASVVASSALSEVVASVPTRLTFQPLVERVVAMAQAPDRHQREAAAEALAATVEGLMDRFHGHVDSIVPVLLALARDPHHRVAERACFAIGRWAVALRQDLVPYEDQLFAQTVTLLGMPHSMTVQAASYALQVLLDDMEQERALRWVHPVMRALGPLVRCPLVQPRSMAIGVIASVAVAAGQAFAPYFAATMAQLEELLQVSDRALLPLRAQASETVGHVANAVGADTFRPHLQPVIHQAMGGLALGDAELDEYTFALFHNLFRCLAEDMRDFAPQLVEYLRSVACEHDVFESVVVRGENMMRAGIGGDEGEDDDNNDDNDDGDDVQAPGARTKHRPHLPTTQRKVAALTTLGSITAHLPGVVLAQFGETVAAIKGCMHSPLGEVRREAIDCMAAVGAAALKAGGVRRQGGFSNPMPLPPNLAEQLLPVVQLMVKSMCGEADKQTVASTCEALGTLLTEGGAAVLGPHLGELVEAVHELLREAAICQQTLDEGGEEEGEEGDHDNILIDAVADLNGELARTGGPEYAPYFRGVAQALVKHAAPTRHVKDQTMALGAFAETLDAIGAHEPAYEALLLPLALKSADSADYMLRGNTAFLLGVLCTTAPDACKPQAAQILNALRALLSRRPGEDCRVVDNANAAIARAAVSFGDMLPLDQIVPAVLAHMPAQTDHLEDAKPFEFILGLLHHRSPLAMGRIGEVLHVCAKAFAPDSEVEPQIRMAAARELKGALSDQAVQKAVAALDEGKRTIIQAAVDAAPV